MLAQVLQDPHARDYVTWLNRGLWLVLVLCVAAVIIGGATAFRSTSTDQGRWGRTMVVAGLTGALAAALLGQVVQWSYDLIVG